MARAPEVGGRVPSVSKGQVIPQRVWGCALLEGQRSCLPTGADALGDKLQASGLLSSHSLGRHINIYLGNVKVN